MGSSLSMQCCSEKLFPFLYGLGLPREQRGANLQVEATFSDLVTDLIKNI
jgi:hypothetical protein